MLHKKISSWSGWVVCISASVFVLSNAEASDYHSPRTAALGGAGHASPLLTDAIYLNPAMAAFLPAYSISVGFNKFSGPDDSEPKGHVLHASVQDGTNSSYQAGVGYTRETYGRLVNLGISSRVADRYSAGIGGKFFFGSDSRQKSQDVMISGIGQPLGWLQTGFTVDNLLESQNAKGWGRYREITLGTKANIEKILYLYFDPHLTPSRPGSHYGYEAGVELPIMADIFLRGGINRNSFQPHLGSYGKGYGFGFGWIFPRLSLDLAIEKTTDPVETKGFAFSITII